MTHPDGFYAEYSYNPVGELTTITDSTGTTLASYTYDALGRRDGIGRASGAGTDYGYDAVSRLAALTQDLAGTGYDGTTTFTHTPSAQLATRTQSNDATYTWMPATSSSVGMVHNGLNQLTQVGSTPAGHDPLGNLETGESTFTYGYDLENRMRSAVAGSTTVSLAYDPLGLLNAVTSNGTTTAFLYDGLDLVAEYNSSGAVLRRYVHGVGMDEPLVWYEGSGTADRRYLHADERGSIVAISNNSGAGLESFKYSPDGESTNAANSRFGYTGQVWLAQVGLYYYKSRMYSPKLGRFLQPDPIGYGGGMNLYAYVGGDPINWVDPLGYDPEDSRNPCELNRDLCGGPNYDGPGSILERDIDAMDAYEEVMEAYRKDLGWLGNMIRDQVDTSFEKDNFERYWLGLGDLELSQAQFAEVVSLLTDTTVTVSQGSYNFANKDGNFYAYKRDFYGTKYDGLFGRAWVIYGSNGDPVGLFDRYDFNSKPWNERSLSNHFKTFLVRQASRFCNGCKPFDITFGVQTDSLP